MKSYSLVERIRRTRRAIRARQPLADRIALVRRLAHPREQAGNPQKALSRTIQQP